MESRQEKFDRLIDSRTKDKEKIERTMHYASDRFDILVIALSSSFFLASVGYLKTSNGQEHNCLPLLFVSWALFVTCTISNLFSQVTSFYGSLNNWRLVRNKIRALRGGNQIGTNAEHNRKLNQLNKATTVLNAVSLLSITIGLISLVTFFISNN